MTVLPPFVAKWTKKNGPTLRPARRRFDQHANVKKKAVESCKYTKRGYICPVNTPNMLTPSFNNPKRIAGKSADAARGFALPVFDQYERGGPLFNINHSAQ